MEVTGKIIAKLPQRSGTSKTGNEWHVQENVLETQESYPKKVHFDFFGAKADEFAWIEIGQTIKLSFDIESREYNGKWYTSVRGWKAELADQATPEAPAAPAAPFAAPIAPVAAAATTLASEAATNFGGAQVDDLPF